MPRADRAQEKIRERIRTFKALGHIIPDHPLHDKVAEYG